MRSRRALKRYFWFFPDTAGACTALTRAVDKFQHAVGRTMRQRSMRAAAKSAAPSTVAHLAMLPNDLGMWTTAK